jgi:AraC-like DNA-binding protein
MSTTTEGANVLAAEDDEYPRAYLYRQVVRAKLYIDAHYAENIDLTSIACEAYFSRHHFLRLFKSMYGTTPQQYRRRVRIDHTKTLLEQGTSVTEACFDLGFESLSAFSTSFKAQVGMRPSVYTSAARLRQASTPSIPT